MKTKSLLQAGALALALTATSLPAAVIFDSLTGPDTTSASLGYYTWSQSFDVPAGNYTLSSVLLGMGDNGIFFGPVSGSGFYVQLWTTVSGAPGTEVGPLSGSDNPYLAGSYTYTGSYSLTGGTSYYIKAGVTGNSEFAWLGGPIVSGSSTYGNSNGSYSLSEGEQLKMEVNADLSPVPEPTEWAAVSLAVLGLVYVAKRRLAPVRQ